MPTDGEVRQSIDRLSPVGKLVHLAYRYDSVDEESLRSQILRERRRIYEEELTRLAEQAGCTQNGRLREGPVLNELNRLSAQEASSIVRTFNRDLSGAISAIRQETPTANRSVYAKRLQAWDGARSNWKSQQIGMHVRGSAVGMAQADFVRLNGAQTQTKARLVPRIGVCPICQALINMGEVDMGVVNANPTPIHPNCPHVWELTQTITVDDCAELWVGQ